jgi:hypothetical protein
MREREPAARVLDHQRLAVADRRRAGRRVAVMPNRTRPFELLDDCAVENVSDQSHPAMRNERLAVGRNDSRRLLPAMLLRVQAEIGEVGGLRMPVDAEHAALFVEHVEWRFFDCFDRKDRIFFSHRL